MVSSLEKREQRGLPASCRLRVREHPARAVPRLSDRPWPWEPKSSNPSDPLLQFSSGDWRSYRQGRAPAKAVASLEESGALLPNRSAVRGWRLPCPSSQYLPGSRVESRKTLAAEVSWPTTEGWRSQAEPPTRVGQPRAWRREAEGPDPGAHLPAFLFRGRTEPQEQTTEPLQRLGHLSFPPRGRRYPGRGRGFIRESFPKRAEIRNLADRTWPKECLLLYLFTNPAERNAGSEANRVQ